MSVSLESICDFIVDCPHSTANDEGAGYPLIRTPNVGKGRLTLNEVHRVSEEVYKLRTQRAVPEDGDIILAREAPAGNAAIIKGGIKVCLGQRTVLIRPTRSKVCAEYLVYYLLAPEQQYKLLGQANGATVAHINIPIIRNLQINLPSYDLQQKIAHALSSYDDLIENNQRQIKLLEEAAQRLYKEWFVDLRFPGYENTPIVNGLPEGWRTGTLSDVAKFNRGKMITKDQAINGDIPVVAGGLEPAYYHNTANTVAPVVTVSGSGANAGFTRMYYENIFASDCSFVDNSGGNEVFFAYCFLKDEKTRIKALQKGSAQPHVYAKDLNAMELVIPDSTTIERFNKTVAPLFIKIGNCEKMMKDLGQARDRLLPKLMSGEMEITNEI